MSLKVHASLDSNGDFVGVLWVLYEVVLQESHAVVLWSAIELSAVPDGAAIVTSCFKSVESLI